MTVNNTRTDSSTLARTDYANAEFFATYHGADLHYCEPLGRWYYWDDQRWREDSTGEVMRRAKAAVRAMYAEAAEIEDDSKRQLATRSALASESHARLRAMIELTKSEPSIPVTPEELDRDLWLLNVLNGTLDLHTGQLTPHRREDKITKLAPVAYDPDAACPTWDAFLDRIMGGNADLVGFLKRAAGYSLTGSTSERAVFFLHGAGRNGKSTFLETLRALLGDYAQRTPTQTLIIKRDGGIPNDVARLKGARFVSASETEDGKRLAESLVKEITGGDTIIARFLRAEFFEFRPEFKLWLGTNHKPLVSGTDPAIWDRIKLIPFTQRIPDDEVDKSLPAKLLAELPGILAGAVRGCLEWQRDGLRVPSEIKAATEGYRTEMDTVGRFLDECCDPAAGAREGAEALYKAFQAWCEANGEYTRSNKWLSQRLEERGFEKKRSGATGRNEWQGLGVKNLPPHVRTGRSGPP
jgi:putative DNA primase/helicase